MKYACSFHLINICECYGKLPYKVERLKKKSIKDTQSIIIRDTYIKDLENQIKILENDNEHCECKNL